MNTVRSASSVAKTATRTFSASSAVLSRATGYSKLERAGIAAPPKGPVTSYSLFVAEQFNKDGNQYRQLPILESSTKLAEAWRDLADSEKSRFVDQAANNRAEYLKSFNSWYSSLGPGELKRAEEILGKKIRIPGRAEKRAAEGPKRPLTAFFLFLKEHREKNPNDTATVSAKQAGESWKTMSEEEKGKYKAEAEKLKAEYLANKE